MNALAIYVPHADANGNIVRYTDTAGNVVAEYTYNAFGRTIAQSGPLADFCRQRFSTKYFDSETGLYYYGYRFYSPALMRSHTTFCVVAVDQCAPFMVTYTQKEAS